MTVYSAIAFSLAMLVLAASPGPGVFATVARALASGFRSSLAVICGIVAGDIIFLLLSTFGLSIVAHALGDLFFVVKICGGLYLVFLGFKIWLQRPSHAAIESHQAAKSRLGNFASGLLITLSNPKVILFYCGFLPNFLDLSALTLMDLAIVLAIVIAVLTGVMVAYAFLASRARRVFGSPKASRRLDTAAGGVMIAAGVAVATRS